MDPEILALLDFAPVPRKIEVAGGWTPELQREFIARLAAHGSANKACDEMGKNRTGLTKLYNNPEGASFRAAWAGAVALAKQRQAAASVLNYVAPGTRPPTIDHRRRLLSSAAPEPPPLGQMRNEYGEWEDEESIANRVAEARENITVKLLRARRLYLQEICGNPGKRAAFEILTELPIDWDRAARLEEQDDEPYHRGRMRKPDMLLTAENGWMGDVAHGPDKKEELRKAVDEYWAELGRPPIDWDAD